MAPHHLSAQTESGRKPGIALVGLGKYSIGQLGPELKPTNACTLTGVVTVSPEKNKKRGGLWIPGNPYL